MTENLKNARADAQRNRAMILEAAISCLASDPFASVAEIARVAGVGRVTLYGHFASRDELLHAVAAQVMHEVDTELSAIPLDGEPLSTLELIARSSWRLIDRFQGVVSAMARGGEAGDSRHDHDRVLATVRQIIERGQKSGSIRADQSAVWLAGCVYSILHNAGAETRAGRISDSEATEYLPSTVRAIMTAGGQSGQFATRKQKTPG